MDDLYIHRFKFFSAILSSKNPTENPFLKMIHVLYCAAEFLIKACISAQTLLGFLGSFSYFRHILNVV